MIIFGCSVMGMTRLSRCGIKWLGGVLTAILQESDMEATTTFRYTHLLPDVQDQILMR